MGTQVILELSINKEDTSPTSPKQMFFITFLNSAIFITVPVVLVYIAGKG